MERPRQVFLNALKDMGFSEVRATRALVKTHSTSVEAAVAWLLEHAEDSDIDNPLELGQGEPAEFVLGVPSGLPIIINPDDSQAAATFSGVGECKVVLVVATELQMSPGKVGAQCAHAALGLYRLLLAERVPWLGAWEESGEKTVVLQVGPQQELLRLREAAARQGMPSYLVRDAGRTEVASGAATVLALGGVAESVDRVAGHLRAL